MVVTDTAAKIRGLRTLIEQNAEYIRLLAERSDSEDQIIISLIQQTADQISLTVSELEGELIKQQTTFVVEADGAYIKQGRDGYFSRFTDSGMEVYSDNQLIARATAETFKAPSFTTDCWTMREEADHKVFNIFRGALG